jgi:hypothetical protein
MTTTTATPKIVGNALYLELVPNADLTKDQQDAILGWRKGGVKQIILFPEYQDDTGRTQHAVIMTREVSKLSPRSQWDISRARSFPKPIEADKLAEAYADTSSYSWVNYEEYNKSEWVELPEKSKTEAKALWLDLQMRNALFGSGYVRDESGERVEFVGQAWVVRESKPLAVEITDEDLRLVNDYKTPQAVIRRINKVRESLDTFPDKLV